MRKKVLYLPPEAQLIDLVRRQMICLSGPTISGNYADIMGEEGAPGGSIYGNDIIDGGVF